MSIDFAHITPTKYVKRFCNTQNAHLVLAHLVERDEDYGLTYSSIRAQSYDSYTILDNSAFELYSEGKPMFEPEKLIDLANIVKADYIVLPDYPGEDYSKTIDAAIEYAPKFKAAGFKTFFAPQSQKGDLEGYIASFAFAASSPLVDYIGVSILGVPNAFDVYDNKLQRFYARAKMMEILSKRELLNLAEINEKRIHFLGMLDGPNEIQLVDHYKIDSWDSSAAVWAGLNGIRFDETPTGLRDGKFTTPVDFDYQTDNIEHYNAAMDNVRYINAMCKDTKHDRIKTRLSHMFSGA